MQEHVVVQQWMLLSKEMRDLIAREFDLKRTGITEICDERVVTDGFSNNDLAFLTKENMSAWVGSDETFHRAWELTIAKARSILNPPVFEIKPEGEIVDVVPTIEEEPSVKEEPKTITNEEGATATVVEVTPIKHETKKSKQK